MAFRKPSYQSFFSSHVSPFSSCDRYFHETSEDDTTQATYSWITIHLPEILYSFAHFPTKFFFGFRWRHSRSFVNFFSSRSKTCKKYCIFKWQFCIFERRHSPFAYLAFSLISTVGAAREILYFRPVFPVFISKIFGSHYEVILNSPSFL